MNCVMFIIQFSIQNYHHLLLRFALLFWYFLLSSQNQNQKMKNTKPGITLLLWGEYPMLLSMSLISFQNQRNNSPVSSPKILMEVNGIDLIVPTNTSSSHSWWLFWVLLLVISLLIARETRTSSLTTGHLLMQILGILAQTTSLSNKENCLMNLCWYSAKFRL